MADHIKAGIPKRVRKRRFPRIFAEGDRIDLRAVQSDDVAALKPQRQGHAPADRGEAPAGNGCLYAMIMRKLKG